MSNIQVKSNDFIANKKSVELKQRERRKQKESSMTNIVVEMTGCNGTLAKVILIENDMDIWSTVKQLENIYIY